MQKTNLVQRFGLPPRPAVLRTESKERFETMSAALDDFLKPQNIIEQMQVDDIVDMQWEKQRLRRCRDGILGAKTLKAVKSVLFKIDKNQGEAAAKQWFGTPEQKAKVKEILAHYGLDESAVEGEAFNQSLKPLDQIGRMLASLEHRSHRELRTLAEIRAIPATSPEDDQQDATPEQTEAEPVTASSARDEASPNLDEAA